MSLEQVSFLAPDESPQPGRGIRPEETKPLDLVSAWDAVGPCYAGVKIDGYRLQLHRDRDRVWLFSRRLQDWTKGYPDVVEAILQQVRAEQVILDAEVVGYDPATDRILPLDGAAPGESEHHKVVVFDLLYLDGQVWMDQPLCKRIPKLRQIVQSTGPHVLRPAEDTLVDTYEDLQAFYEQCLAEGFEGILVKAPQALYRPGSRSLARIKVKPADTIDAVILGYDVRRVGSRITGARSFLVGVYDQKRDLYVAVAKANRGRLPDPECQALFERVRELEIPRRSDQVTTGIKPDVWVDPVVVVEIEGHSRRPSRKYVGGLEETGVGYRLSDARLSKRGMRQDKGPEDATSLAAFLEFRLAPGYGATDTEPHGGPEHQQLPLL